MNFISNFSVGRVSRWILQGIIEQSYQFSKDIIIGGLTTGLRGEKTIESNRKGIEFGFRSQKLNIIRCHNLRNDERIRRRRRRRVAREGFKCKMQSQLCKFRVNRGEYAVTVTGCVRWIRSISTLIPFLSTLSFR